MTLTTLLPSVGQPLVNAMSLASALIHYGNVTNTNEKCSIIWNSLKMEFNSEWWTKCSDTSCLLGARHILEHRSEPTCRFAISSEDFNSFVRLDIIDNLYSMDLREENIKASAETDFKDFIKINWENEANSTTAMSSLMESVFENGPTPPFGSFSLERTDDKGVVKIHINNGETTLSGECQLGSNEIICENHSGSIFNIFGNKVRVTFTKKEDNGVELFHFDVETIPSISLIPSKHLGSFQVALDSSAKVMNAIGDLKSFFGEPLFFGEVNYQYAQDPWEPLNGNQSVFEMKFGNSTESIQNHLSLAYKNTSEKQEVAINFKDVENGQTLIFTEASCEEKSDRQHCQGHTALADGTEYEWKAKLPTKQKSTETSIFEKFMNETVKRI